jgi:hypothetical protein
MISVRSSAGADSLFLANAMPRPFALHNFKYAKITDFAMGRKKETLRQNAKGGGKA